MPFLLRKTKPGLGPNRTWRIVKHSTDPQAGKERQVTYGGRSRGDTGESNEERWSKQEIDCQNKTGTNADKQKGWRQENKNTRRTEEHQKEPNMLNKNPDTNYNTKPSPEPDSWSSWFVFRPYICPDVTLTYHVIFFKSTLQHAWCRTRCDLKAAQSANSALQNTSVSKTHRGNDA